LLLEKIQKKDARVGVVGLGYVGLPLAIAFSKAGFSVTGLDIDIKKIACLMKGKSYIKHIPSEDIQSMTTKDRFIASVDFSLVSDLDCILLCVPTPLTKHREPDMSFIIKTAQAISPHLSRETLIVLESTTYPGTTQEVLIPELESANSFKQGQDFLVAYSPEREDPNNPSFRTADIPKVVGAESKTALEVALALYGTIIDKLVPVANTKTAEATKLMENVFRAVNIALVNELKVIFEKMDIDVWEVIEAAKTKPFGYMPFYPGPGLGGHCIPIDPFYLTWKAREHGIATRFIELAGEINISMPHYVTEKILSSLNRAEKKISASRILLLGLAYKKNVDDERESVTYKIIDLLQKQGAHVDYNDPFIHEIKQTREHENIKGKKSVSLNDLDSYDLTAILTDHSDYDYESIVKNSKIVIDTRNACKDVKSDKIIKA
jgi:UDP-N-acetyl-D-glucosamine dehydrogenase